MRGMISTSLWVGLLSLAVLGRTIPRNLQVHEARAAAPSGFVFGGPAASDAVLSLRIALVQSNIDGLVDALYDGSDPSSAKYGQHMSKAEVCSLVHSIPRLLLICIARAQVETFVTPNPESVTAVNTWLAENDLNATVLSPAGDWLGINVSVSKANELLSANYSVFTHQTTKSQTIRTLSYSLPAELSGHVDLIHPTIGYVVPLLHFVLRHSNKRFLSSFPTGSTHSPVILSSQKRSLPRTSLNSDNTSAVCGTGDEPVTPGCLQYIYNIPSTPASNSSNGMAVTGYDGEYAQESDLQVRHSPIS